jgi:LPXTG-motif cell wall-anchored protein
MRHLARALSRAAIAAVLSAGSVVVVAGVAEAENTPVPPNCPPELAYPVFDWDKNPQLVQVPGLPLGCFAKFCPWQLGQYPISPYADGRDPWSVRPIPDDVQRYMDPNYPGYPAANFGGVLTGCFLANQSSPPGVPTVPQEVPTSPSEVPTNALGVVFTNEPAFAGLSVAAPAPTGVQPSVVTAEQPPAAVLAGNLPRTGSDSRPLATVGVLLVLAGVAFLVPTLRRRRHA